MHSFRTFLGDDEDFSNLPGGVSKDLAISFFCLYCGLDISAIYGAWPRVWVIGLQLAIRVGGRVACPVVVFSIFSGKWFSVLVIDLLR